MKILRRNWGKLAGTALLVGFTVCAVYAWGQTAPVLNITRAGTNQVAITVTNGVTNGQYQIYYKEYLSTNYQWIYLTNGAAGQTNFTASMGDTISGFFEASYNNTFVTPTITVIIQSPTNGALIY